MAQLGEDQASESGQAEAKVKFLLKSPSSRIQGGEPCCPLSCRQLVGYQTIVRDCAAVTEPSAISERPCCPVSEQGLRERRGRGGHWVLPSTLLPHFFCFAPGAQSGLLIVNVMSLPNRRIYPPFYPKEYSLSYFRIGGNFIISPLQSCLLGPSTPSWGITYRAHQEALSLTSAPPFILQ